MFNHWGKAGEGRDCHPLPYHQLDVAAVAARLLARHPTLGGRLIRLSGLPEDRFLAWVLFFVAVHDLGKFASAFQQLRPELAPPRSRRYFYSLRHDTLGYLLWINRLNDRFRERLCGSPDATDESDYLDEIIESWVLAVTGHHGQPPRARLDPIALHFAPEDEQAAIVYAEEVAGLFLPAAPEPLSVPVQTLRRSSRLFSWWLSGLTILSDWLGSNREFFPFHAGEMPLELYWRDVALPAADVALDRSGILPNPVSAEIPVKGLFEYIHTPTPLQLACREMPMEKGPQLFLVEDVTGAGKTEAAFVLLNRLLAGGNGEGAYLALPTMATANAMYRRTAGVYRRLFAERGHPTSLVLAHGSRHLNDGFRDSVLPAPTVGVEYAPGETDAGARCRAWLADGSKRSLLAQLGVGTVDQSLLAVLTSRHQSLRLLGLLGKVLIVDEVHASDAYMHRLLCELLTLHARGGGSAILLSATLPKRMRQELAAAFCEGIPRDCPGLGEKGYPLLTRIGVSEQQVAVPTRQSVARSLDFAFFHDESSVLSWIVEQADAGACVAWVRNSVADALDAVRCLGERMEAGRISLFHARFAMGDRLAIENEVIDAFGAKSGAGSRAGRVLVATQVIEQSLDLDFDEMVTDLAPMDLLIQRAGRLRRHARDRNGDRVEGEDLRGPVRLHVLMPDPDLDADRDWYVRLLPRAAPIYPDHGQLWLTASLMKKRKTVSLPEDLRACIEGVFGDGAAAQVPHGLRARSDRSAGQRSADASLARFNSIRQTSGYRNTGGEWWDESRTPTRLGEVSVPVRLARWDGHALSPWQDEDRDHPWAMSEVRVRRALLAEVAAPESGPLAEAIAVVRSGWSKGADRILLLPLCREGEYWEGSGLDERNQPVRVIYSSRFGLQMETVDKRKEAS